MRRHAKVLVGLGGLVVVVTAALAGCTPVAPPAATTPSSAARLVVSGDLAAHDPDLIAGQQGAPWFVYSTGDESIGDGNIQIRESSDGHNWKLLGTAWTKKPSWLSTAVPGVGPLWAPMLIEHDGTWFMYYAASTFGSNRSVIALATNTTLDPRAPAYGWVDRGVVIASHTSDDFNAIDPTIIDDPSGTPWMAFGSFWGGIQLVKLQWPSGGLADAAIVQQIAYRGSPPDAIEGATILEHGGAYFLIVSRDLCCQGVASTYNMAVGRAATVQGPYLDRQGHPMVDDGGSVLLASSGSQIGPGGESYSNGYLAWHFYDAKVDGATTLAIQRLGWTADGWPSLDASSLNRK
ncbi:MAG: arabinan endo-1,5-alpha-L-arabinosidase [Actinomycetota bacterium]|nr:arabinan endo-1,5-alpha-L-arabinosidase [Actinomycetota bacterium]